MGWVKTVQFGNAEVSSLPADKWPWQWTYAIILEHKWEQIREVGAMYDDDGVPTEYWHDSERVEAWIKHKKEEREDKMKSNYQ